MIAEPTHLEQMLARLKLTAIRDQLDSLLDEGGAGRADRNTNTPRGAALRVAKGSLPDVA